MKTLNEAKENLAKSIFGITANEAWEKGICVQCKKPAMERCYSQAGYREYLISGMCECCFDALFSSERDER